MDVLLAGSSAGLSVLLAKSGFLPGTSSNSSKSLPVLALGLSLGLISLCILDALPASWSIILSKRKIWKVDGEGTAIPDASSMLTWIDFLRPSLESAYRTIFWIICFHVLVITPFLMGARFFSQLKVCCCSCSSTRSQLVLMGFRQFLFALSLPARWIAYRVMACCYCNGKGSNTKQQKSPESLPLYQQKKAQQQQANKKVFFSSWPTCLSSKTSIAGGITFVSIITPTVLFFGAQIVQVSLPRHAPFLLETKSPSSVLFDATTATYTAGLFLAHLVASVCAVGVLLSALLNGFGSVSYPLSCVQGWFLTPISMAALTAAEHELVQARIALQQHYQQRSASVKNDLSSTTSATGAAISGTTNSTSTANGTPSQKANSSAPSSSPAPSTRAAPSRKKSGCFGRIGEELEQSKHVWATQNRFLQQLVQDLTADVQEMREARAVAAAARTGWGRIRTIFGLFFSVLLLMRLSSALLTSAAAIQFEGTNASQGQAMDWVTTAVLWILGHKNGDVKPAQYETVSQCLSLGVSAFLSVTQVRAFHRTTHAISRRWFGLQTAAMDTFSWGNRSISSEPSPDGLESSSSARGNNSSSSLTVHIVSCGFLCYCLACSVVTTNLRPPSSRESLAQALGGINVVFVVHPLVVQCTYAVSALISATFLGIIVGIQRQNTLRYQSMTKCVSVVQQQQQSGQVSSAAIFQGSSTGTVGTSISAGKELDV